MPAEKFANTVATTLSAAVDALVTSIAVADAAPVALRDGQFRVRVGDELMLVTATGAAGASPWTVERGVEGTAAVTHASAAAVTHVFTAGSLRVAAGDINEFGEIATPYDFGGITAGSSSNIGVNGIFACRVTVPRTGTLRDLAVFHAVSGGNIRAGVYDTGDALAGSRTLLHDSGPVVASGAAWQIVSDPGLPVTAGQQLDFAAINDNGLTNFYYLSIDQGAAGVNLLPANFRAAAGGASPKLAWSRSPGSFILPATITEANCALTSSRLLIIGRVV